MKHLVVSYLILTRGGGVKINIDPPQIGKLFFKLMKQCVKRISLNCKLKILTDLESDSKGLFEVYILKASVIQISSYHPC